MLNYRSFLNYSGRVTVTLLLVFSLNSITNFLFAQKLSKYQIVSLLIQDEAYTEALSTLEDDNSSISALFKAKIYYRQNLLVDAKKSLSQIRAYELDNESKLVFYKLQLFVSTRLKNYNEALFSIERLVQLKDSFSKTEQAEIQEYYTNLLFHIPIKQRASLILNQPSSAIAADILTSSLFLVDLETLTNCKNAFLNREKYDSQIVAKIINQAADTANYIRQMLQLKVPVLKGLDTDILLPLPVFENESAEFGIVSGLYNGMLLKAENYNTANATNPIHFSLLNTLERSDFLKNWRELINNTPPDAVIGPLFSENLSLISSIPNPSSIPVFAPLANTVNLAESYPWIYQLNPTFENRGREAARFLSANFDSTQTDSILIIAERGSLGETAASAFAEEIKKDSLFISEYLVEDFAASAYDLRPYSHYFTTDTTLIDSLSINTFKVVYAPFSGATSETMINFLLTGLESNNNFPLILGSGEWENYELSGLQALRYEIWFDTFQLKGDSSPDFNEFLLSYEQRFGTAPNQQAILGYDIASFLLEGIQKYGSIDRFIHLFPYIEKFNGLSINLDFSEQRANKSLHYLKRY